MTDGQCAPYIKEGLYRISCGVNRLGDSGQGRRSGYESGGDGIHVNPERSFGETSGEPPSEASQLRKGGLGALPRKISKNLHGKWCNLRYS